MAAPSSTKPDTSYVKQTIAPAWLSAVLPAGWSMAPLLPWDPKTRRVPAGEKKSVPEWSDWQIPQWRQLDPRGYEACLVYLRHAHPLEKMDGNETIAAYPALDVKDARFVRCCPSLPLPPPDSGLALPINQPWDVKQLFDDMYVDGSAAPMPPTAATPPTQRIDDLDTYPECFRTLGAELVRDGNFGSLPDRLIVGYADRVERFDRRADTEPHTSK